MKKKVDSTFIIRKHIISELEEIQSGLEINNEHIKEWAEKWWAKDKKLFVNTLLFILQHTNKNVYLKNSKIISYALQSINDKRIPDMIMRYIKKIKVPSHILMVLENVFRFYNKGDLLDNYIKNLKPSVLKESREKFVDLVLDGYIDGQIGKISDFFEFLDQFTYNSEDINVVIIRGLSKYNYVNLLNLYEFLIELPQRRVIIEVINSCRNIIHPETVLFLDKVIERFKDDEEIKRIAIEARQSILNSALFGKDNSKRKKFKFEPLTPFDIIYITPIERQFLYTITFFNTKKSVSIVLFLDLVTGINNFEIYDNLGKEKIKDIIKELEKSHPIHLQYKNAMKIISDSYYKSLQINRVPLSFFAIKKMLSKTDIVPEKWEIDLKNEKKKIYEYLNTHPSFIKKDPFDLAIETLNSRYTSEWFYFTKKAYNWYKDLEQTRKKFEDGKIDKEQYSKLIGDIHTKFSKKYIVPELHLWKEAMERSIKLMVLNNDIEIAAKLYFLNQDFLENYNKYINLPEDELSEQIGYSIFFGELIQKSLLLSKIRKGKEEFEDYFYEEDLPDGE